MPAVISEITPHQSKALAITPKITAAISLLASSYIIYDVLRMPRDKRKSYHRLLLGMSFFDLVASAALFLTTWPIPPEVLPVYGASGTQQTCTAQGFFAQLGSLSGILYNGGLAFYYFLVIHLGWTDAHLNRAEYFLHGVPILLGVGTSVVLMSLGLFNPTGFICWTESVPLGCLQTWQSLNGETTCTRGDNAALYQWAFYYAPLWLVILAVTGIMGGIVRKFWKQEKANARYTNYSSAETSEGTTRRIPKLPSMNKRTKETTLQAVFYIGSFLLVYFWPTVLRIHTVASQGEPVYYLLLISAIAVSSQGFWNLLVYLRPRYIRIQAERKRKKRLQKRTEATLQKRTEVTQQASERPLSANDAPVTTDDNRPQDKDISVLIDDVSPPVVEQLQEDDDFHDGTETERNPQNPTTISRANGSSSRRLSQILVDFSKSIALGDSGLGCPVVMMALQESLGDEQVEEAPEERKE